MKITANTAQRGALIVFEGCDRSGKTTVVDRLVKQLNGTKQLGKDDQEPAKMMRFPDRTTRIGQDINDYLQNKKTELNDREVHLLFSENRREKETEMKEALNAGQHVIIDRYAFSGVAFSAAKEKEGMDLEWCRQPDRGLPKPDLVCLLDVSPEEASKRGDYGNEKYEKIEFQAKVRDNYRKLKEDNWEVINTDGKTPDQVFMEVEKIVKNILVTDKGNIQPLWPMK